MMKILHEIIRRNYLSPITHSIMVDLAGQEPGTSETRARLSGDAAQHSADSTNPNYHFPNATRQKSERRKQMNPTSTSTSPTALHHLLARCR
jgi:hypothetical protein